MNITSCTNVDPVKMAFATGLLIPLGMFAVKEAMDAVREIWQWTKEIEKASRIRPTSDEMSRPLMQSTVELRHREISVAVPVTEEQHSDAKCLKYVAIPSICFLVAFPIIFTTLLCYSK